MTFEGATQNLKGKSGVTGIVTTSPTSQDHSFTERGKRLMLAPNSREGPPTKGICAQRFLDFSIPGIPSWLSRAHILPYICILQQQKDAKCEMLSGEFENDGTSLGAGSEGKVLAPKTQGTEFGLQ